MNQSEHLIEEKILQYQTHLSHLDKLVDRVDKVGTLDDAERLYNALTGIKEERELLLTQINKLKCNIRKICSDNIHTKNPPMIIWEVVANKLEKLITPFDHY